MTPEDEGRSAAARFRRDHRLGHQPLGDLVALIEQATGIDVAVLDAGPDEHGLTMRDPKRHAVFIGVARTRNPMRQRSTLAHELGHVLFEDWSAEGGNESRADAFARHLLLPAEGLREFLGSPQRLSELTLSAVVQRFLASPAIAAIALQQAGYLTAGTKQEWLTLTTPRLAARYGWSDQYHALQAESDRRRAPQRLLARAVKGYAEGVLSAQAIGTLRGITPEAVEEELRQAGITPVEHPIAWTRATDLPDPHVDLEALEVDLHSPHHPDAPPEPEVR